MSEQPSAGENSAGSGKESSPAGDDDLNQAFMVLSGWALAFEKLAPISGDWAKVVTQQDKTTREIAEREIEAGEKLATIQASHDIRLAEIGAEQMARAQGLLFRVIAVILGAVVVVAAGVCVFAALTDQAAAAFGILREIATHTIIGVAAFVWGRNVTRRARNGNGEGNGTNNNANGVSA